MESSLLLPISQQFVHLLAEGHVLLVELPLLPSRVLGNEGGFDKPVQLVEEDIAEDGAHNRALRDAAEGSLVFPVLQIAGTQQLFDEVEKAHYDIFNILLQILEDGVLTDSFGRKVDFSNTILILTSNIGGRMLRSKNLGFGSDNTKTRYEEIKKKVMDEAKQIFNPEFLNRIDEIEVFKELDRPEVMKIVDIMINEIKERLSDKHIELRISRAVKSHLLDVGFNREMGARTMRRAIEKELEDALAERILSDEIADGSVVKIGVSKGELTFTEVERKKITKNKISPPSKKDGKVKKDPVT